MVVWDFSEIRLRNQVTAVSAANALSVSACFPGPPAGKVWVILAVGYKPSVAETKVVSFRKYDYVLNVEYGFQNPFSMNLNPAVASPMENGIELYLFPNQFIKAERDSATAGSSMTLYVEYIEIDIPLYDYTEPQAAARIKRLGTSLQEKLTRRGGGIAMGGGGGPAGTRGGRTGPLPK